MRDYQEIERKFHSDTELPITFVSVFVEPDADVVAGLTYTPANITGKQTDGEKFTDRINGDAKQVVCLYIQSPDNHETDTIAQQALDQELPF